MFFGTAVDAVGLRKQSPRVAMARVVPKPQQTMYVDAVSDNDQSPDDTDIQVVAYSTPLNNLAPRQLIAFLATAGMVVIGAYLFWPSGSDDRGNVTAVQPGAEAAATDATVPTALETTTSSTTSPPTTIESTTTSLVGTQEDPSNENSPERFCSWLIPNLVGKTLHEVTMGGCPNQYVFGLGPMVTFEFYTVSEPCTTDPALFDRIASQSPSPGTPFGGGTVRINLSIYRNCDAPTTSTMVPPPPPVPTGPTTPPITDPPPTAPDSTTA